MDFDGINLADAWKKWKQTMQLYSNAAMNQKTAEKAGEIFNTWPGKRSQMRTINQLMQMTSQSYYWSSKEKFSD